MVYARWKRLALALSLYWAAQAPAQDCGLLRPLLVPDVLSTSSDIQVAESYVDYFSHFESYQEAESRSRGFGFSIVSFLDALGISGSSNDERWMSFRRQVTSLQTRDLAMRLIQSNFVQKANPALVQEVRRCVTDKGKVHAWIETTGDPAVFKLALTFISAGEPARARINAPVFQPASISCKPKPKGRKLGGETKRFLCQRGDPKLPVTIVVNANIEVEGGGSLTLPARPGPPAPVTVTPEQTHPVTGVERTWTPPHVRGDKDFDDRFRADGEAWLELSADRRSLFLRVRAVFLETEPDNTEASGDSPLNADFRLFEAPAGRRIKELPVPSRDRFTVGEFVPRGEVHCSPPQLHDEAQIAAVANAGDCFVPARLAIIALSPEVRQQIARARRQGFTNNGLVRDWWIAVSTGSEDDAGRNAKVRLRLNDLTVTTEAAPEPVKTSRRRRR